MSDVTPSKVVDDAPRPFKLSPLEVVYLKQFCLYDEVTAAPHSPQSIDVLRRAKLAADKIDKDFEAARVAGEFQDLNQQFKAMRKQNPTMTYGAFAAKVKRGLMVALCAELIARRARF